MKIECTGVILAGGNNTRLPGRKKTFRTVGNRVILEAISTVFADLFSEIIIVVNEPEAFAGLDMMVVTDIIPHRCALAGLHAGLFYASCPYAYVTACDTPFINKKVIKHLLNAVQPRDDVVIPRTVGGLEPLAAVYSKRCLPRIETNLQQHVLKIKKFFNYRKVREIPVDQLKQLDPDLFFSFNVNTPEDLETAEQIFEMIENQNHGKEKMQ